MSPTEPTGVKRGWLQTQDGRPPPWRTCDFSVDDASASYVDLNLLQKEREVYTNLEVQMVNEET